VGANPLATLKPPAEAGDWDEQRLALPPETGIHAIDAEIRKLTRRPSAPHSPAAAQHTDAAAPARPP
jgi:hypothetical protein